MLPALLALWVSTALAAELTTFSPEGIAKGAREVRATFSEPMVRLGDPRPPVEPFRVQCPEKGVGRWADPRNWVYSFQRELPGGLRCRFELNPELKAVDGSKVKAKKKVFEVSTGGPTVTRTTPWSGGKIAAQRPAVVVFLDAQADPKSVEQHAHFEMDGRPDKIPLKVLGPKESEAVLKLSSFRGYGRERKAPKMILQATLNFPPRAKVALRWGARVASPTGATNQEDQVIDFTVEEPFRAEFSCERENAQAPCTPFGTMSLQLNRPVEHELLKKIALQDRTGKTVTRAHFTGEGSYLSFRGPFPAEQELRVVLPGDFRSDDGEALDNAASFPLKIKTGPYPPLAKFADSFGVLESADPVLPITVRRIENPFEAKILSRSKRVDFSDGSALRRWMGEVEGRSWGGEKRAQSIFETDEVGVRTLQVPGKRQKTETEVIGIPLDQGPGLYVTEIESQLLGSALLGINQPMYVSALTLVTNLAVHLKKGRENYLVWVTHLQDATPVEGADVKVMDCEGKVLGSGRTAADGAVSIPAPAEVKDGCWGEGLGYSEFNRGVTVVARKGDDASFVHSSMGKGLEPWRFNLGGGYEQSEVIAHSVLDRELVRAGEAVRLVHVVRKHSMSGVAFLERDRLPKVVEISHSGSSDRWEYPLSFGPDGVAETRFEVPKEAKLGTYRVTLLAQSKPTSSSEEEYEYTRPASSWASGTFRVEEFRVPLVKGVLQVAAPSPGAQEAHATLGVHLLAGGAWGEQKVNWRWVTEPASSLKVERFEDVTFSNGHPRAGAEGRTETPEVHTQETKTSREGITQVRLTGLGTATQRRVLRIEAEYPDPNGQIQTASTSVALRPAEIDLGVRVESRFTWSPELRYTLVAVDSAGRPAAGVRVGSKLRKREWLSRRKRLVGGLYHYESEQISQDVPGGCSGTTNERGMLSCKVEVKGVNGLVEILATATDSKGHRVEAWDQASVYNDLGWAFDQESSDRIDLIPEKLQWEAGQKARIEVRTPFQSATALITVEREGVLRRQVQKVDAANPWVEVELKPEDAPNVYVSVFLVRGRVAQPNPTALVDLAKPSQRLGMTRLQVGWAPVTLKVDARVEKAAYRPREKAKLKIEVKPPVGTAALPKGAAVTVAVVDEGLLMLRPNGSWKLLEAMMQERPLEVATSTLQSEVIGKRHYGLKAIPYGGGGGMATTRELFDTLLFFEGQLKLDSSGRAEVEIPIQDSLTEYRVAVVARAGPNFFGQGGTKFQVNQEILAFAGIAPAVRGGDEGLVELTLSNTTDRPRQVSVELKAEGKGIASPRLTPAGTQTLNIAPQATAVARWQATMPVGAGTIEYVLESRSDGWTDRIKVSQSVSHVHFPRVLQAEFFQLDQSSKTEVERPSDAVPGLGSVNAVLSASLLAGLSGPKEYMRHYPYSCMEQQVSQAIVSGEKSIWDEVMARLPSYIDSKGLVDFYPSNYLRGSDSLTSHILAIAHEKGWEIPASSRQRMIDGLKKYISGHEKVETIFGMADHFTRKARAIEALSRYGVFDSGWMSYVQGDPANWPIATTLDLWSAWERLGSQVGPGRFPLLSRMDEVIRSRTQFQASKIHLGTEDDTRLFWIQVSPDYAVAQLLLMSVRNTAWDKDAGRVARGLIMRQKSGRWDSTTSNAWATVALEKFAAKYEKDRVTGSTTYALGGTEKKAEWSGGKGVELDLPWPDGGKGSAQLSHSGSGKPWVQLRASASVPLKKPLESGFRIEKKIEPVIQAKSGQASRGDVYRVRLTVHSSTQNSWVVVDDPIPSGAMILGSGLGGEASLLPSTKKKTPLEEDEEPGFDPWNWMFWDRSYPYPAFTERTHLAFRQYYSWVPQGKFELQYTFRVNQPGRFELPATHVEAMYNPEQFADLPNAAWKVEP